MGCARSAAVRAPRHASDLCRHKRYTGKLFEYLGARRPILAIGPADNVAAALIRERQAGIVSSDPAEIAGQLSRWLEAKERGADIPDLPASVAAGLSREEQTRRLERFLERFVGVASIW